MYMTCDIYMYTYIYIYIYMLFIVYYVTPEYTALCYPM